LTEPFIPLSEPYTDSRETAALAAAAEAGRFQGGGPFMERVEERLRERLGARFALMMTSCTHALETCIAAHGIGAGDEVVIPSFTHPSSANAVLRAGARVVFADSLAGSPHMDPEDARRRVSSRTRAIMAVHYAGIPLGVDGLAQLCREEGLLLLEDAAQALDARFGGRACGTLGDGGCLSFHDTKNVVCGEGGVLLTDDEALAERATVIREMGTDRALFRAGRIPRYTWREVGSSFMPSELLMAFLEVQLEKADEILSRRRRLFDRYLRLLSDSRAAGRLVLPELPEGVESNGHVFYMALPDRRTRDRCLERLRERRIGVATHFEALHDTAFGRALVRGDAPELTRARRFADTLLRVPLHARMTDEQQDRIVAELESALDDRT